MSWYDNTTLTAAATTVCDQISAANTQMGEVKRARNDSDREEKAKSLVNLLRALDVTPGQLKVDKLQSDTYLAAYNNYVKDEATMVASRQDNCMYNSFAQYIPLACLLWEQDVEPVTRRIKATQLLDRFKDDPNSDTKALRSFLDGLSAALDVNFAQVVSPAWALRRPAKIEDAIAMEARLQERARAALTFGDPGADAKTMIAAIRTASLYTLGEGMERALQLVHYPYVFDDRNFRRQSSVTPQGMDDLIVNCRRGPQPPNGVNDRFLYTDNGGAPRTREYTVAKEKAAAVATALDALSMYTTRLDVANALAAVVKHFDGGGRGVAVGTRMPTRRRGMHTRDRSASTCGATACVNSRSVATSSTLSSDR